jgi:hypothetical protein
MVCDLCRHDDAVEGSTLCQVCYEAILRLANAVKANAEVKPQRPSPRPSLRMHGPGYFQAAASAGSGDFRSYQVPLPPPSVQSKAKAEDTWPEELLPDFTD